jgi:hypothetical protein
MNLGFDDLKDYRDVLKNLLYKEDIQSRFLYIQTFIPIIVHLLTISSNKDMLYPETILKPQLQKIYSDFELDMNNNLDTIYSKKIIRPSSLIYAQQNKPSEGLSYGNPDSRILYLFPTFILKIEELLTKYLVSIHVQNISLVIQEIKTELNIKLYQILLQL